MHHAAITTQNSQTLRAFPNSISPCDTLIQDQLRTMLCQDKIAYKCIDYIGSSQQIYSMNTADSGSPHRSLSNKLVNEMWRQKICEWCYEVVDRFGMNREVVAVSLNLLDRVLAKVNCKKKQFQLAAMTTLNIAIKLHARPLKLELLVQLSRGCFTEEDFISCELFILRTLAWNVHPPTAVSFARNFGHFLPSSISSLAKKHIEELSEFLLELAVCDYSLVVCPSYLMAIAAILNAIDDLGPTRLPQFAREVFLENISDFVGLENNYDVISIQEKIAHIYQESVGFVREEISTSSGIYSPVCVSTVEDVYDSFDTRFKETDKHIETNMNVTTKEPDENTDTNIDETTRPHACPDMDEPPSKQSRKSRKTGFNSPNF